MSGIVYRSAAEKAWQQSGMRPLEDRTVPYPDQGMPTGSSRDGWLCLVSVVVGPILAVLAVLLVGTLAASFGSQVDTELHSPTGTCQQAECASPYFK